MVRMAVSVRKKDNYKDQRKVPGTKKRLNSKITKSIQCFSLLIPKVSLLKKPSWVGSLSAWGKAVTREKEEVKGDENKETEFFHGGF